MGTHDARSKMNLFWRPLTHPSCTGQPKNAFLPFAVSALSANTPVSSAKKTLPTFPAMKRLNSAKGKILKKTMF
ncbi:hypothetical protein C7N43_28840 [Sphingobacteriales bacterium UPWRP_1]|nr:hypothetical protein B6N25_04455 [Sphingobacteriales bacterium TSM_CSS]PSJ73508.1 hypothetical protein C7N43_28840 [Sphingobacteriales bacterium UPWRP_1]